MHDFMHAETNHKSDVHEDEPLLSGRFVVKERLIDSPQAELSRTSRTFSLLMALLRRVLFPEPGGSMSSVPSKLKPEIELLERCGESPGLGPGLPPRLSLLFLIALSMPWARKGDDVGRSKGDSNVAPDDCACCRDASTSST